MEFAGKVAIVTGAGSGIGASLTRALWARGARVVLAGRRPDKLDEVAGAAPSPEVALCVPTDVTRLEQLEHLKQRTLDHFGTLDAVFNNAGIAYGPTLEAQSPFEIERQLAVNLQAPIQLTRLCLPALTSRPEAMIVNVASMSGLVGLPYQSVYAATKHGLRGFGSALRRELLETNVRVMTVYPTTVETEIFSDAMREKADKLGFPVMSPDHVAEKILAAARRDETEVLVCTARERFLPLMERWMPWALDSMSRRLGQELAAVVGEISAHSRRRDAEELRS